MKKVLDDLRYRSFKLRAEFDPITIKILEVGGLILFLVVWTIAAARIDNISILPSPYQILISYKILLFQKGLLPNLWFSLKLNILGLLQAIAISLPIGFLLGLFPLFKYSSKSYIDALRYLPLGALLGLFITYFGIGITMKVQFLSFAIMVYLIPTVILRIVETKIEFEQTAYTLGASKWQIIQKIYIPDVSRRVFKDIITLVAISWTYITISELVNKTAGVGAMIYELQRQSRLDQAYAALFSIILVGFAQDKLFNLIGLILYPSEYRTSKGNFIKNLLG